MNWQRSTLQSIILGRKYVCRCSVCERTVPPIMIRFNGRIHLFNTHNRRKIFIFFPSLLYRDVFSIHTMRRCDNVNVSTLHSCFTPFIGYIMSIIIDGGAGWLVVVVEDSEDRQSIMITMCSTFSRRPFDYNNAHPSSVLQWGLDGRLCRAQQQHQPYRMIESEQQLVHIKSNKFTLS